MKHYFLCSIEGVTETTDGEAAFEWFRAHWRDEMVWVDVIDAGHRYTWLDSAESATRSFMFEMGH